MISADMAHAYHPNFPLAYDPDHKVTVNKGPVIKVNANHRYSTESVSQAMFVDWCEQAGVPYQKYSHRSDLALRQHHWADNVSQVGYPFGRCGQSTMGHAQYQGKCRGVGSWLYDKSVEKIFWQIVGFYGLSLDSSIIKI